jgi:putative endonuclease
MKHYFVYILSNKKNGTLYIGVTSNLIKRVYEHKNHIIKGFSSKYGTDKLVYFEQTASIVSAIEREKRLKVSKRRWKIDLINQHNPDWKDLYNEIV